MNICDKEKCTGCYACYNICPKKCITMSEDEYGYIYPSINKEQCIKCNLCIKTCPQLKEKLNLKEPQKAYAVYNKNNRLRCESTSGGAATTFYMHVLNRGGVVYGLNNIQEGKFNFIRITQKEELTKVKGSKYVHGYIGEILTKVKEDLDNGQEVLFIGTPCQVSGLKAYLKKDYEKLITVDLICHGVPSQRMLNEEISRLGVEKNTINRVLFRNINGFFLELYNNNNLKLIKDLNDSYYYKGFMDALFYRENCYECRFATNKRVSDITIGDFWGLSLNAKINQEAQKGISVVLPITEKGMKLFDECKENFEWEERKIEEAIKGNDQLREPSKKSKYYKKFRKLYLKKGFTIAYKKSRSLRYKLRENRLIYNIYSKIKGKKDE